jgi:hypothetical protein
MIAVMIAVMIIRLDTRIVRSAGKISRIGRYRHVIGYRGSARKARLLRIRTQRSATGGRRVDERIRNVIPHYLVRCGIEVHSGCGNRDWRNALLHPIDQWRRHIELVSRGPAGAMVHIRDRIEPREVLGAVNAAEPLCHLRVIQQRAQERWTRIAGAMIPDDLVPVLDEVRDVQGR